MKITIFNLLQGNQEIAESLDTKEVEVYVIVGFATVLNHPKLQQPQRSKFLKTKGFICKTPKILMEN